jgi:predicted heme/steroid binding protein
VATQEPLQTVSRGQLALRNGQDKPQIWIAFRGIVYDVTESKMWRNGKHYEHWAGQDLTPELEDAPHTEQVFERLKIVGKLIS